MCAFADSIAYADLPLERVAVWLFPKNMKKNYPDDKPWVDTCCRLYWYDIKGLTASRSAAELGL